MQGATVSRIGAVSVQTVVVFRGRTPEAIPFRARSHAGTGHPPSCKRYRGRDPRLRLGELFDRRLRLRSRDGWLARAAPVTIFVVVLLIVDMLSHAESHFRV